MKIKISELSLIELFEYKKFTMERRQDISHEWDLDQMIKEDYENEWEKLIKLEELIESELRKRLDEIEII